MGLMLTISKVFITLCQLGLWNREYPALTCGGNVNNYKSVYHPIPTLSVGNTKRPGKFQDK